MEICHAALKWDTWRTAKEVQEVPEVDMAMASWQGGKLSLQKPGGPVRNSRVRKVSVIKTVKFWIATVIQNHVRMEPVTAILNLWFVFQFCTACEKPDNLKCISLHLTRDDPRIWFDESGGATPLGHCYKRPLLQGKVNLLDRAFCFPLKIRFLKWVHLKTRKRLTIGDDGICTCFQVKEHSWNGILNKSPKWYSPIFRQWQKPIGSGTWWVQVIKYQQWIFGQKCWEILTSRWFHPPESLSCPYDRRFKHRSCRQFPCSRRVHVGRSTDGGRYGAVWLVFPYKPERIRKISFPADGEMG